MTEANRKRYFNPEAIADKLWKSSPKWGHSIFNVWIDHWLHLLRLERLNTIDRHVMEVVLECVDFLMIKHLGGEITGWTDVLGEVYECMAGKYKKSGLGQFFTPKGICAVMAKMTIGEPPADRITTILDPTSGSGRTLIDAADYIRRNWGKEALERCRFYANDIDSICAKMCRINFALYGMSGEVTHSDGLSPVDNYWGGWRIGGRRMDKVYDSLLQEELAKIRSELEKKVSVAEDLGKKEKLTEIDDTLLQTLGFSGLIAKVAIEHCIEDYNKQYREFKAADINHKEGDILYLSMPGDGYIHWVKEISFEESKTGAYFRYLKETHDREIKEAKEKADKERPNLFVAQEEFNTNRVEENVKKTVRSKVKARAKKRKGKGDPPPQMSLF